MERTLEGIVKEVRTEFDHFVENNEPRRRTTTLIVAALPGALPEGAP